MPPSTGSCSPTIRGNAWTRSTAGASVQASWFYRRVFRRLREGGEHEINSFLPPSAEGMASHLRLDGDEPDWERCAARLLTDEGLETALLRFACLPRTVPQVLRDAVRAETSERIDPVFERLRAQCLSLLMRLHLFALLVERATVDPTALEIARSMKADIVSGPACKESYPGFHAILRWTFRWFQRWPEMIARNTAQQLALGWLHAVRLHDTLLLGGVSNEVIHRHFFAAEQQLHPGLSRGRRRKRIIKHVKARGENAAGDIFPVRLRDFASTRSRPSG